MEPILIVLGIILIIVVGGGLWLYAGRRRGQVPDEVSAHKPMSVEDLLPSEEDEEPAGEGAAEAEASTAPAATSPISRTSVPGSERVAAPARAVPGPVADDEGVFVVMPQPYVNALAVTSPTNTGSTPPPLSSSSNPSKRNDGTERRPGRRR